MEGAEICSKVLDWKVKHSAIGEQVCHSYLLYVEELSLCIERSITRAASQEGLVELKIRAGDYKRKV